MGLPPGISRAPTRPDVGNGLVNPTSSMMVESATVNGEDSMRLQSLTLPGMAATSDHGNVQDKGPSEIYPTSHVAIFRDSETANAGTSTFDGDDDDSVKKSLYHDGWSAKVAQDRNFENFTLAVISFNAIWIGVDMELNDADMWTKAHPVFQIADNFFCVFFSIEVIIRFLAFREKCYFWRDKSFVFDTLLVVLMVFETWVLVVVTLMQDSSDGTPGFMSQISVLRLLRLLRLTRMARLMRSMPELMTLMKGLVAAVRSVTTTFLFQIGIMWIFGIIFTQTYRGADENAGEAYQELHADFFPRLGISMVTLFVQGTLLDELTSVAALLREDSTIMMLIFFTFVLLSSLTLLNMLIGILTAVVSETAESETQNLTIQEATRTLRKVFSSTDSDKSDGISYAEFEKMLQSENSDALDALLSLGIQEDRLQELGRQLFEENESDDAISRRTTLTDPLAKSQTTGNKPQVINGKELSFERFMDELLLLRPGDAVSVRDITTLRRAAGSVAKIVKEAVATLDKEIASMTGNGSEETRDGTLGKPSKLNNVPTPILVEEIKRRLSKVSGGDSAGGGRWQPKRVA